MISLKWRAVAYRGDRAIRNAQLGLLLVRTCEYPFPRIKFNYLSAAALLLADLLFGASSMLLILVTNRVFAPLQISLY
jgi:hypothetical protein